jgi:dihydropteroate synthase
MNAAPAVPLEWRTARGCVRFERPAVVGILNVTPDSFWDGGRHEALPDAIRQAQRLVADGADLLDIGGESTRPGALPVPAEVEAARIIPIIEALRRELPDTPLSVDTVKAGVARAAMDAGAAILNDVSGLRLDPAMAAVAAETGAGLILMHSRGAVADMASYRHAVYGDDCVGEIVDELGAAVARARQAGVSDDALVLDPGLGFSKMTRHSLAALAGLERVAELGLPVLVGPSRKRFVGEAAGGLPPEERLEGTIAACVIALLRGARLFRVHDVAPVRRALDLAAAVLGAATP